MTQEEMLRIVKNPYADVKRVREVQEQMHLMNQGTLCEELRRWYLNI